MAAIYNFNPQIAGDTFEPRVLSIERTHLGVVQDLTGATGVFEVFRKGSSRIWMSQTVEILDAENCIIRVREIKNTSLTPYIYNWRIRITYADGDIKTYIGGLMPIVQFNTDDSCLQQ